MAVSACWFPALNSGRGRNRPLPDRGRGSWPAYEDVEIAQPDTKDVPNSGPTVASRTAMIVGKLVHSAARGLKQTLTDVRHAWRSLHGWKNSAPRAANTLPRHGALRSLARYEQPPDFSGMTKTTGEKRTRHLRGRCTSRKLRLI